MYFTKYLKKFILISILGSVAFLLISSVNTTANINLKSLKKTPNQIDSLLFNTLSIYARLTGLKHRDARELKSNLQIDPRMVKVSYNCCKGIPDFVQVEDLAVLSSKLIFQHKQILKKYNIPETNLLRDQACIFSGGLPEPPPHDHSQQKHSSSYPKRCEKQGFFLTVFFSQPKLVPDSSCKEPNKQNKTTKGSTCRRVLAFEYTSYSRFIYALYLNKNTSIGWKVVRKEQLFGVFS